MNELQIFENPKFGNVRTITEDGKTLFCGSDVARALGYKNTQKAIRDHCKGIEERWVNDSLGRQQNANFIPEGDIYRLAARSELPGADEFERWIFDEVLPSIRKHGGYIAGQENMSPEELLARALVVANSIIEETKAKLKEAESNIHMLSIVNRQQQPMVDYFMACVDRNNLTSLRETAKLLHVKEKKLVAFLLDNKYLYRSPTGIVESVAASTITAIEGNTSAGEAGSQSNGGGVFRRKRSKTLVTAYIRAFDDLDKEDDMEGKEIFDKLNEYMKTQKVPTACQAEYQEAVRMGITDGTSPCQLVPRWQAALMAKRAAEKAREGK